MDSACSLRGQAVEDRGVPVTPLNPDESDYESEMLDTVSDNDDDEYGFVQRVFKPVPPRRNWPPRVSTVDWKARLRHCVESASDVGVFIDDSPDHETAVPLYTYPGNVLLAAKDLEGKRGAIGMGDKIRVLEKRGSRDGHFTGVNIRTGKRGQFRWRESSFSALQMRNGSADFKVGHATPALARSMEALPNLGGDPFLVPVACL